MKKKSSSVSTILRCAIIFGLLAFVCVGSALGEAEVKGIDGTSKIIKAGERDKKPLGKGDVLAVGDSILTEAAGKTWVRGMANRENHVSLGEESVLLYNDESKEGDSEFLHLHVPEGIVRFILNLPRTDPLSSYTITTPSGMIGIEPIEETADFVVQVISTAQTMVTVIRGAVRVSNIDDELNKERIVLSCQMVYVNEGEEASRSYWASTETLKDLIKRTTIPDTLPDEVPDCEAAKTGPPPDWFVDPDGPEWYVVDPPWFPPLPPLPWTCPCPWGEALDPVDGQCKPCAFAGGAFYNPLTCSCECCPGGGFFNPITGTCVPDCPGQAGFREVPWPNSFPNALPHEGCRRCGCCEDGAPGCVQSTPQDASCPGQPPGVRCGQCPPGQAVPPAPGAVYPCALCCACDVDGPAGVCALNFAGYPKADVVTCPGANCITLNDCLANGGWFVQSSGVPGWPCWICQPDFPMSPFMGDFPFKNRQIKSLNVCGPCQKTTFKKGKRKCVPIADKTECSANGKCGRCKKGKCVELPPCPKGQVRNARCKCEKAAVKPPKCTSNSECRKATAGARPCCERGKCVKLRRCPDGKLRCKCKEDVACGACEVQRGDKCLRCEELGMVCRDGRCYTDVVEPCPPCSVRRGNSCIPCQDLGMECRGGACYRPSPIVEPCPRCTIERHGRCIPCGQLGMRCNRRGQCKPIGPCPRCTVKQGNRCVSCRDLGMVCDRRGRCKRQEVKCPRCTIKKGNRCVSCQELGMACDRRGRCKKQDVKCPRCTIKKGNRCVSCQELGMACDRRGRCKRQDVKCPRCTIKKGNRCVSCKELGMACDRRGRCSRQIAKCPRCSIKKGNRCVSCQELGMACNRRGLCVARQPKADPCKQCYAKGMNCVNGKCVPKEKRKDLDRIRPDRLKQQQLRLKQGRQVRPVQPKQLEIK